MQDTHINAQQSSESREALFEQLSSVMAMHGHPLTMETYALLQPLLSGSLSYAEHRELLESALKSMTHE